MTLFRTHWGREGYYSLSWFSNSGLEINIRIIFSLNSFFSKIEKAYLIGSSAEEFSNSLKGLDHDIYEQLDKAVLAAYKEAKPGDTILLAPGCASFDQFKSFEDRGDKFRKLVNGLS